MTIEVIAINPMKTFGNNVAKLQKSRGYNATEAAIQADMNYGVYMKAVEGEYVTIENAVSIVNVFGAGLDECFYNNCTEKDNDDIEPLLNLFSEHELQYLYQLLINIKVNRSK